MVKVVDPDAGGKILTTLPARPPEHLALETGVPPPVGQKNACAGKVLFGAFQKPVPWMVTNVLPVMLPAVVPESPVTVGATGAYVKVGTKDDVGAVWLVPPGVVTLTKYALPTVTAGEVTWMQVERGQPPDGGEIVATTGAL